MLSDHFSTLNQIYLGIYFNPGPTCLTRLDRNHVPLSQFWATVFTSLSEDNSVQISVWNPNWVPYLGYMGRGSRIPLSFASSMGIFMQEDDTITQARVFASDGFTMAQ
ncbi:hypothetical protein AVEN_35899-1 [Araneus ventricosus]|uniref:Uncharacterized protein n=1 Tax=Araneus ventricosus TaxID=182803 RepID=A0A4Y2V7U2_ARAVE|nr:hypothetical protein AVEN_35899-1 [Araneus ventricosus]